MNRRIIQRVLSILALFSVATSLMAVQVSHAATQQSGAVTRAAFLDEVVSSLYGENIGDYSVPFTKVPDFVRPEVGLARRVGALPARWGSEEQWNAVVSRCEALNVLLDLAQVSRGTYSMKDFRDVRTAEQVQNVQQGLAWNLLQPLTPTYFGCGRALSFADLTTMLVSITVRVDAPLDVPVVRTEDESPNQARQRLIPRENIRVTPSRSTNGRSPRATITIETPSLDHGRTSSHSLPKSDLLEAIWGLIQSRYLRINSVDQTKIAYDVAKTIVGDLGDKYSEFMPPQQAQNFRQSLQGELSGIGAQVESNSQGGITVVTPLPGSPAIRAGVHPGDHITHVDGVSILENTLQEAVEKIRGPAGSTVDLTIERNGASIVISVTRAKIVIPEIEVNQQDGVMVVKLIQFGDKTRSEFTDMLRDGLASNPAGIILDLRNNPGGLLDAAIDVASHFLPEHSLVVQIREPDDLRKEDVRPDLHIVPATMPVVVLVNKGSASASEIVAGALQDHKRASIVGAQTFGKGTVQEVVQFQGGESLKFTIAEWLTPDGRSIEGQGVTPDITLDEQQAGSRDEQLLEAIRIVKARAR